jgi:hypothetical protein
MKNAKRKGLIPLMAVICMAAGLNAQAQIAASDEAILTDLYNGTDGPHWIDNFGWLNINDPWFGVTLNGGKGNELVLTLTLPDNGLVGTLPESLGNLSALEILDLSGNSLYGRLPTNLSDPQFISAIDLSSNYLSGEIPPNLGSPPGLRVLFLEHNRLQGRIPDHLPYICKLNDNQLSGPIPTNLSAGALLDLGSNRLRGPLPVELGDLNANPILLANNDLCGTVPDFTNFSRVTLDLRSNYFDIAPGSVSLANIEAMIAAGCTVFYSPQKEVPVRPIWGGPGPFRYRIDGEPGHYLIQCSEDQLNWSLVDEISLDGAGTHWLEMVEPNNTGRYYRHIGPL